MCAMIYFSLCSFQLGSAWLFALIGGPSTDYFGRKFVILAASVVFMAGAVVMGIAESKEVLLVGRVIIGAGIGLASMSVPMYISESAPPNYRGFLVTCNNLVITGGQFFAACVCGFFSKVEPNGWKYMLGLAGIPSFLQFVGFLFMPESPRWLVSKGKIEKARQVLTKIRANTSIDPEEELEEIKRAVEMEETTANTIDTVSRIFRTPSARRPLVLGCLLQIFQQVAGINTVMYYSATIITMAGFSNTSQAIWMSAGVASINFLCTFIALPLVERIGRRKLLLASLFGVTLSLVLLGVGFQVTYIDTPKVTINATVDDFCNKYSDCASCTYDALCGYCFQMPPKDSDSVAVNASCEMKSDEDDGYSKNGRCIKDNVDAETVIYATDYCPSDFSWLVVFGLCLYLFFFAPGMGPMPWTINSEIYPTWARSSSQSIATSMNWAFNLLVSMTFLSLTEAITKQVGNNIFRSTFDNKVQI